MTAAGIPGGHSRLFRRFHTESARHNLPIRQVCAIRLFFLVDFFIREQKSMPSRVKGGILPHRHIFPIFYGDAGRG
jgi:hypothetical protein